MLLRRPTRPQPKQPAQALVEFGLVALLFTLLMFAIVDFGLLMNSWLSVTSGARELARSAAVGKNADSLQVAAGQITLFSISTNGFAGGLCCDANSAVEVKVEYIDKTCSSNPAACAPITASGQIALDYPLTHLSTRGSCVTPPPTIPPVPSLCHPMPDDTVRVTVIAHGAQIITPLVRPFFGCSDGAAPNCNVQLQNSVIMRYEGKQFT
jgi:hypothetical protein